MSKFKINPAGVNTLADGFEAPESKLKSASVALAQIAAELKRFSSTAEEGAAADLVAEQLNTSKHAVNRFRTAIIAGSAVYSNAENLILSRETTDLPEFAPYEKYTPLPVPSAPGKAENEEEKEEGWEFKAESELSREGGRVFSHNGSKFDGAKHYQKGWGKNKDINNNLPKNKLGFADVTSDDDHKTKPGKKWYCGKPELGASIGVGISRDKYLIPLAGKKVGDDQSGASVGVGHYELEASAGANAGRVWDDDKRRYVTKVGAGISGGASISAIGAEAHGRKGWDNYNVGAKAKVDVGKVEAKGAINFGLWDDGFKPNASIEGSIGAYAVSAEVGGSMTVLGVKTEASAAFKVGAALSGKLSFKDYKIDCELGACLGIGFEVKINVDFSGVVKGVSEAIDWVKDTGKKAVETVSKAVDAVKGAAKSVVNFFKKWF